jgi:hypothetical protein
MFGRPPVGKLGNRIGCGHVSGRPSPGKLFGIAPVVLVALDVRFHMGRWHDSNFVPKFLKLAGPVMPTAARFQLGGKLLHLHAPRLTSQNNGGINSMNPEHVLRYMRLRESRSSFARSDIPFGRAQSAFMAWELLCLVALSGQPPKPGGSRRRREGLTAKARTERATTLRYT